MSSLALMFAACGDSENTASPQSNADMEVRTYSELPSCAEKRDGKTAYVADQEQEYICQNGKWVEDDDVSTKQPVKLSSSSVVNPKSSSSSSISQKLSSSSSKNVVLSSSGKSSSSTSSTTSSSTSSSSSASQSVVDSSTVVVGNITDSRDGQSYKTVTIGTQTWMAQNLNYETANSCCYGDTSSNCNMYGRLYTWGAAASACPSGWHLPTKEEFETLFTVVGGQSMAGKMLKSTIGWSSSGDSVSGTDAFPFSALPAGYRNGAGDFKSEGEFAYFWSSTENNFGNVYLVYLYYNFSKANMNLDLKSDCFSVRCVKGELAEQKSSSSVTPQSSSSTTRVSSSSVKSSSSIASSSGETRVSSSSATGV